MNVLVIGNGAREHALCWKIKQSPLLKELYNLPYSDAINEIAISVNISTLDFEKIYNFCLEKNIDFVIVGPEEPLSKGIADYLALRGIMVFGPKRQGAMLEASKQVAKEFMQRNFIPTADFKIIYNSQEAKKQIKSEKYPIVIKVDGLASGKGVRICNNEEEAISTIKDFMEDKIFGSSGSKIIIEEYLKGYECSVMAIVDSKRFLILPVSKDHKRLLDGDNGPNTGGMGAICPLSIEEDLLEEIKNEIMWRFIVGIGRERILYQGIIYAGLMITEKGPKVLEFNCRFGDPETQSILPLIKEDLLEILWQAAKGKLEKEKLEILDEKCVSVVISSKGYPFNPIKGDEIEGLDEVENDIIIFHSGTKKVNGKYITNGGRVLSLSALGKNFKEAREKVYRNIKNIKFNGMHYRRDIGNGYK